MRIDGKENDNQDRHEFGGEGSDFDPNDLVADAWIYSPFPAGFCYFWRYYDALGLKCSCVATLYEYKPAFGIPQRYTDSTGNVLLEKDLLYVQLAGVYSILNGILKDLNMERSRSHLLYKSSDIIGKTGTTTEAKVRPTWEDGTWHTQSRMASAIAMICARSFQH